MYSADGIAVVAVAIAIGTRWLKSSIATARCVSGVSGVDALLCCHTHHGQGFFERWSEADSVPNR
jgi:hypothetical protein